MTKESSLVRNTKIPFVEEKGGCEVRHKVKGDTTLLATTDRIYSSWPVQKEEISQDAEGSKGS
jgi:hypothetical protein